MFEGIGVNKFNTLLRVVYTLGLYLMLSQFAYAQSVIPPGSVLNFAKATVNQQSYPGFAVTNPTSNYADVTFTFYGLDGNPVKSEPLNPVRYRVAPKGQISILATDIFGASTADGWVQATSPTPGLVGSYLSGDFATNVQGSQAEAALFTQVIPLVREDAAYDTQIVIVNPGTGNANVTVQLYSGAGQVLGTSSLGLGPYASVRVGPSSINPSLPADYVSARITSTVQVAATAVVNRSGTLMSIEGQPIDQQSPLRIASQFLSGPGFTPVLVLANPTSSPIPVIVTLASANGGPVDPLAVGPSVLPLTIPAYGLVSKTPSDIIGRSFLTPIDGWLRVDSSNTALDGVVVLDRGQSMTAETFQLTPQPAMLYSEVVENQSTTTGLVLINPSGVAAAANAFLVEADGTLLAQYTITVPANSKLSEDVGNVIPAALNQTGDYILVTSSSQLYSTIMIYQATGFIAAMGPVSVPPLFTPDSAVAPMISVVSGTDVQSGAVLQVWSNVISNLTFIIGDQVLQSPAPTAPIPVYQVQLPALDPGYVTLRARSNGVDSPPVLLHVLQPDNTSTQPLTGRALYQKIDVTDAGLNLANPVMFPIRHARVEVYDPSAQAVFSVSETDDQGGFTVAVPPNPNLIVRVVSRIRSFNLLVEDNTNLNAPYLISAPINGATANSGLLLSDNTRLSGAFNILEVVQRANATVKSANPNLPPLPVTIFWSTKNTHVAGNPAQGLIGTSEFNVSTGTAYILGDITTDSDEYDDAVIAHEYAHMLAAKYSRDESPGGPHSLGDMLDPRLAWSEGWANFFSSVVRNDPIWRDSYGPNGTQVLRYDLGNSTPSGDPNPGYWSEASVDTLLWALYDGLDADNVPYSFSSIWAAFTDLQSNRFVYLPYFLDHLVSRVSSSTSDVIGVAQFRNISYLPGAVPDVANPFPEPIAVGATIGPDTIDSYTTKRTNLITSSHFYTFTTSGGATTVRMDITGPGRANNPNANDLDLFLYNGNGQLIDVSDSGGNGQGERIADRLAAGTYFVEVRSYYTNGDTGVVVYNSGDYTLSVSVQ